MLAERLHLSGILTMVVFAMAVARRTGGVVPARIRIPSYAVWEFAVFAADLRLARKPRRESGKSRLA